MGLSGSRRLGATGEGPHSQARGIRWRAPAPPNAIKVVGRDKTLNRQKANSRKRTACGTRADSLRRRARVGILPRPGHQGPGLPQGPTQEETPEVVHRQRPPETPVSEAREWAGGETRALALPPSQGAQSTAGCAPSFLRHPLYVTMANPHVVLAQQKCPQGVRASWGCWAAGCWAGLGAACHHQWALGPRLWREKGESEGGKPGVWALGLHRLWTHRT